MFVRFSAPALRQAIYHSPSICLTCTTIHVVHGTLAPIPAQCSSTQRQPHRTICMISVHRTFGGCMYRVEVTGNRVQPILSNPTSATIVQAAPDWAMLVYLYLAGSALLQVELLVLLISFSAIFLQEKSP